MKTTTIQKIQLTKVELHEIFAKHIAVQEKMDCEVKSVGFNHNEHDSTIFEIDCVLTRREEF